MKNRYGLERAATNFKWWIIGVFSVIAIGTASAMYVGGELESALFEKLATDPTGTEGQVYYNTTEKKAKLYNGSAWTDFGSGDGAAGAGEINYNDDPDGASNWTELGDGVTVSTTVVETEIPRWPIKTQAVKLTNDTTGTSGWSVCVEVGEADRNKKLKIEWAQLPDGTNYTSGDFEYQLVSETNDTCTGTETGITLHSSGDANPVSIPNQAGVIYDEFDATDAQYYELKFLRDTSAQTNSGTLAINDLVIGPGKLHSGAVVTAWEAFTPAFAGSGWTLNNGTFNFIKRRLGDSLQIIGKYTVGSSDTPSSTLQFVLPDSLTHANVGDSTGGSWGFGYIDDASNSQNRMLVNIGRNTSGRFYFTHPGEPGENGGGLITNTAPFTWTTGDEINFNATFPIAEWAGSGVMNVLVQDNLSEWTDFTANLTNFTEGNATQQSRWRRVGDSVEVDVTVVLGSTSSVTGNLGFNFNTNLGLTLQTDKDYIGSARFFDAGGDRRVGVFVAQGSTNDGFFYADSATSSIVNATTPYASWGTGDLIHFHISVPVQEYAGSQSSLVGFSAATETQSGLVSKAAQKWSGNKSLSASNTTSVDASSIAAETVPLWKIENDVAANGSGGGFFVETRGQGWGGMSVDAVTTADAQVKFWTSTTADTPVLAMTLDRNQNATVTGSIGAGSFASSLKNKYQIKTLSADVTASGTLSDLTFSNLTIGKIYRVTLNASVLITGTSATELATIRTTHNSATIATARFRTDSATDATTAQFSSQVIFTASATTVTFEFTEAGTQVIQGNNNQDETFAMIEELVNYEVTSAF